jgi:ABC-type nickel/cobalt efflux system permease component RcnA
MEVDESIVIAVGTAAWFVAWLVLFVLHGKLEDHDNEWYLWTAAAGLGLGVWGWWLVRKRVEARKAGRTTPADEADGEVESPAAVTPEPARGTGRRRRAAD